MLRIRPSPAPRTRVTVRTKRPPMAYIELLSASEEEFQETVKEIESDPLFEELRVRGIVKRRGGRGRMPREVYEKRLDTEVAAFIRRHGLDEHPQALEQIQQALQSQDVEAVAKRLGAPVAEIQRLARFFAPASERLSPQPASRPEATPSMAMEEFVAGSPAIDVSEAIATVKDFVERFSLSQQQLVTDFLHGEETPTQLARRYHTSPEVIRRIMDAVNFILTADIITEQAQARGGKVRAEGRAEAVPIVARVYLRDGEPQLHFGESIGYGLRYVINPEGLDEIGSAETRERAEALLRVLRHINQRRSVQCRVVAALFDKQRPYFASGNELDLMPVTQAELARELEEPQSTISRTVRGRYVETPYGTHELQFYCQRKRDVILRLSAAYPDATDRELQQILRDRYGCNIARRTVAYHRHAHRR